MKRLVITVILLASLCVMSPGANAEDEAENEETADTELLEAPEEKKSSIFDLMGEGRLDYQVDMAEYYLDRMAEAVADADVKLGHSMEEKRNEVIDVNGLSDEKISFDDFYLLARVISFEAGSDWLSDDYRLCTGEVVMNRVESCEFPDSISGVINQKGQYTCTQHQSFYGMTPSAASVDAALRLLKGERKMVPSVVFRSNEVQGEIFSVYTDRRLGTTYFCISNNLDLYE